MRPEQGFMAPVLAVLLILIGGWILGWARRLWRDPARAADQVTTFLGERLGAPSRALELATTNLSTTPGRWFVIAWAVVGGLLFVAAGVWVLFDVLR